MMRGRSVTVALSDNHKGILWMLVTGIVFMALDAIGKYLVLTYPVWQFTWARFTFHMLLLVVVFNRRLPRYVLTAHPRLQLARSIIPIFVMVLFFVGIRHIPLTNATAIMFLTPIIVTALSAPLLGEQVGLRRWLGVVLGVSGALIIIRPGSDVMHWGSLLVVGGAVLNASYLLLTRQTSHRDSVMTNLFYSALGGTIVSTLILPFVWVPLDLKAWALMIVTGLLGGTGHFTIIKAYTVAPAPVVAPFAYTYLLWATLFGYLLFGEVPDGMTLFGAAVIIGSGLYIFHREKVRKEERTDR